MANEDHVSGVVLSDDERKQFEHEQEEYNRQKHVYDHKWLEWGTKADLKAKPPAMQPPKIKDFPMLDECRRRREKLEMEIQVKVLNSMTVQQRNELTRQMKEWEDEVERGYKMADAGMYRAMPTPPPAVQDYFERIKAISCNLY